MPNCHMKATGSVYFPSTKDVSVIPEKRHKAAQTSNSSCLIERAFIVKELFYSSHMVKILGLHSLPGFCSLSHTNQQHCKTGQL